jgi:hypothetical protein
VGIKEIVLTHPIARLRLSTRSVDEVPRAGVQVCQRDDCVCRLATSEQLLLLGVRPCERGEMFRKAPLPDSNPAIAFLVTSTARVLDLSARVPLSATCDRTEARSKLSHL